ncbi:50S ribosomal protein L29 [Immundisolibacter sp.]|jgi:large subunit ribosomal protein L29|uniref:50S ribosomal protein L29 n=1 Tax=Immundisolibacter sp. TaxID=1934948 RepID=UPI002B0E1F5E|nr:50S ribosomal protein L29 [Immundisolibacter sp.]MEA3219292.1 50S ribosomal protein L29 [Immundisolibacter sp.]
MKIAELRGKSAAELNKKLIELHREHLNLRVQRATGQLAQPSRFRALRREVAQIKTLLKEQASQASA